MHTDTEGAERNGCVNVAIQSEYGKVQEFCKATLLESLKVCVQNMCTLQDVRVECTGIGLLLGWSQMEKIKLTV